ncbi:MAG: L-2-amino-thiazoline-4-carboxylic acid hydrolase [Defluviitaleaceae bacterium]|nr:L-2-amino-thiazoline-4-carboxylic acid hydrolase [Defluviitaleaceae bacterium]
MSVNFTPEQEKQVKDHIQQVIDHFETKLAWQLKIMQEYFGDEAYHAYAAAQAKNTSARWRKIAEDGGNNTIEALIKRQWEPLSTKGYEYTMEQTDEGFHFTCTKCPAHDIAKRLGITEQAFHMWCRNDYAVAEGFNPNIGLKITKTLMQGHSFCDHFYYYKDRD